MRQPFIAETIIAQRTAYSYRRFQVGASVYVVNNETDEGALFVGGNYKPYEGAPKICAEKVALTKAAEAGYHRAIGFIVTGPLHESQAGQLNKPTLPPCGDCRQMFEDSPMVDADTYVLTFWGPDAWSELKSVYELNTTDSAG